MTWYDYAMDMLQQLLVPALTGLFGLCVNYMRNISKDVKAVADAMHELGTQLKFSVQELTLKLNHTDDKIEDLKDRVKTIENTQLKEIEYGRH